MRGPERVDAVVLGASAGGFEALRIVLDGLNTSCPFVVIVVQHLHHSDEGRFSRHLSEILPIPVETVRDKLPFAPGRVYVAPSNYHMMVEHDGTVSLSLGPRVNFVRPSVDVFLESAARVWGEGLMAVILTGANSDGAQGVQAVVEAGGRVLIQDPETALAPQMPWAALRALGQDHGLTLEEIRDVLHGLCANGKNEQKE